MLNLLAVILGCDREELSYIEDCKYDLGEIGKVLIDQKLDITLQNICDIIFNYGWHELNVAFDDTMNRLVSLYNDGKNKELSDETTKKLKETMDALKCLNPNDDMIWNVNEEDIVCYLDNKPIYEKYLGNVLSRIETNMGFEFEEL